VANGIRVRKDVWKLAAGDPTLQWYAKAVAEMQRRPIADPTSWRYQAAIHGYVRAADPNKSPGDRLPSAATQRRFWSQCQHGSWYFLSWHRMYLFYFERIVAAAVAGLGGPADWALPYWNYSDPSNPNARRLPPAFRTARMRGGANNPLRIADRDAGNAGEEVAGGVQVDLRPSLTEPSFVAQALGGSPGFGGPRTLFQHGGGRKGALERLPHDSIHGAIGGWMGSFETAGLDPIFWLHHANIDRLWAVWRARLGTHRDPTDAPWLTGLSFRFHDAAGGVASLSSSQVVDTTAPPLGYRYEDVSDPLGGAAPAALGVARSLEMERETTPEMVGATEGPVPLTGQSTTARLAVGTPTGPARLAAEAAAAPPRIYLNLENITGSGKPTDYAVYLNLPPGADPEQHGDLFAGVLPTFGVAEASRADRRHSGGGVHHALEVGDLVRRLQGRNDWDPSDLRVTFVPLRRPAPSGPTPAPAAPSPMQVGRVSLYYA